MRFKIPDSLLEALRARRNEQRHERADARGLPHQVATTAPNLLGIVKKLMSNLRSDVEQVAVRDVHGMNQLQDEVEHEQDAFLLDPGMGPMTYITADGRVLLDLRTWDGEPMREATDDEAIAVLVVGAKKTSIGELLDLIPARPPDGLPCPRCSGMRWSTFGEAQIVCTLCCGRGWATREAIARADEAPTP